MYVNRRLIVGTLIIIAAGVYNVALVQRTAQKAGKQSNALYTRVLVGAYLVAIVLSIADLITPLQQLAGAFLMLAVVTALITILPDLASRITTRQQTQK